MNIGEVFARAWHIIWKYKILWIFGLLTSLAAGTPDLQYNFRTSGGNGRLPNTMQQFFQNVPAWVWVLVVLGGLVLFLIFVLLATIGRAGLIRGAWIADAGEASFTVGSLFSEGMTYFVRLILLALLIAGIMLSVVVVITLSTVLTLGLAMICLLPLLCVLVPILILLSVIVDLSIVAIVGENRGVIEGLQRGWEVFRAHPGEIIFMALVILIGSAVANFLIGLPAMIVLTPLLVSLFTHSGAIAAGGVILSILLFLVYLPILLAARAVVTSYIETTWTVTFRRLTGHPAPVAAAP